MRLAVLASGLLAASALALPPAAEEALDPSGLPAPAWYTDPEIATTWERLTGKYIYQRSCTSCHTWGPDHMTRAEWNEYLRGFPENHDPDVGETYADLTARFHPAAYVPNRDEQHQALRAFLEDAAPTEPVAEEAREAVFEGFPAVGDPAPDFEIVDTDGRRHSPGDYRDKKKLILVFSRAHW